MLIWINVGLSGLTFEMIINYYSIDWLIYTHNVCILCCIPFMKLICVMQIQCFIEIEYRKKNP